jgi:acetate kinase
MATRVGDLDPGVVIFLLRTGTSADQLEGMLNRESGLGAISGGVTDMRQLLSRTEQGDSAAALAVEIFVGAVRKFIAAYAAELGGLDLLVFTGGIGENSGEVRGRVCNGLDFLGIRRDGSGQFSQVVAMTSEEETQIARHCRRLMR